METNEFNKLMRTLKSDKVAADKMCKYCLSVIKLHLSFQFRITQDLDDLAHDIFLKIFEKPPATYVIAPVAWLCKITDNFMFTLMRNEHQTYELIENIPYEMDESVYDNIMLEEALAILDEPTRQVFMLHHCYGYKLKDIGPMIGKTYDAVRQIHSRTPKNIEKLTQKKTKNSLK